METRLILAYALIALMAAALALGGWLVATRRTRLRKRERARRGRWLKGRAGPSLVAAAEE
jgi:hypothetical protein